MLLVEQYARQETTMLLNLYSANPKTPLFDLSEQSSELIFALQDLLAEQIHKILADKPLTEQVLENYIPTIFVKQLGMDPIVELLGTPELQPYRDTIISKKLASMAFYKFGMQWDEFLAQLDKDMFSTLHTIFTQ